MCLINWSELRDFLRVLCTDECVGGYSPKLLPKGSCLRLKWRIFTSVLCADIRSIVPAALRRRSRVQIYLPNCAIVRIRLKLTSLALCQSVNTLYA